MNRTTREPDSTMALPISNVRPMRTGPTERLDSCPPAGTERPTGHRHARGARFAVIGSLAAMALAFSATPTAARTHEPSRPNVIVIVTDDQGYADVGFNGSRDIPTPNIDRIAHEGVRFTRGYVTYPVCAPSRAGLMTGRYPARFGFDRNPNGDPSDPRGGVPRTEQLLSEALHDAGYTTMAIGKWHLGTHLTLRPRARGFDEFYGFLEGGHSYMPGMVRMEKLEDSKKLYDWYGTKLIDNNQRVNFSKYLTEEFSQRAQNFVSRMAKTDKPFFLYLAYNAPHTPLQATEKYLRRFDAVKDPERRTYMAMISAVDDGVGQLLSELDRDGLAQNTIVFFLSDNGGVVGGPSRPRIADNAPLRGGKSQLFEGGIRVPFAMRWPGRVTRGSDYDRPVSSMDIFGTLAALLNLKPPHPLDGVNLLPFLAGQRKDDPHPVLFWRKFDQRQHAMVVGDLKYMDFPSNKAAFELRSDVSEAHNMAKENGARLDQFEQVYQEWLAGMAPTPAFPPLGTWPRAVKAEPASEQPAGQKENLE